MLKALLALLYVLPFYQLLGQQLSTDSLLVLAESSSDSAKIEIYLDVAIAYRVLESDKALDYATLALEIAEKSDLIFQKAEACHILGAIYVVLGDYQKASRQLQESVKLYELVGYEKGVANASNTLGILYFDQEDYANALKYYRNAFLLVDSATYPGSYATYKLNIGEVYQAQGENDLALKIEEEALHVFEAVGDKDGMAYCYGIMGRVFHARGQTEKALSYGKNAINLFIEVQDHLGAVEYFNFLVNLALVSNDLQAASDYAFTALKLSKLINSLKWEAETYDLLAKIFNEQQEYLKAYKYKDTAAVYRDSLMSIEKQRQVNNLRIIYESTRKEQENELLKVEKQLQNEKIAQQKVLNLTVIAGLLLIAVFAAVTYRGKQQKQKANNLLQQQNEEINMQREEIETQSDGLKAINQEVSRKNQLIEEKNKNITDSINYARRIQNSLLSSQEKIAAVLPDHFILYQPKDIVSGDFYWIREIDNKVVVAVADCTGHGIPGAFMSFIGHDCLKHVVSVLKITEPDKILKELKSNIIEMLEQDRNDNRDGMDISICVWDKATNTVKFAGANHSIIYIQHKQIFELKGNRTTISFEEEMDAVKFEEKPVSVNADTMFYLFTDGYVDQFGGPKDKKFMMNRFRELLLSLHDKTVEKQEMILKETMNDWMQDTEQVDDILVMGFRLPG